MSDGPAYLKAIRKQLDQGHRQWRRGDKLLAAFGYVRRRQEFVDQVNAELASLGLVASPPISTALALDGYTSFSLIGVGPEAADAATAESASSSPAEPAAEDIAEEVKAELAEPPKVDAINPADLSVTVRNLECANRAPLMVTPSDTLASAMTKMQLHDYSQLVAGTGERSVKGVISYRSIANQQMHGSPKVVGDCIEQVPEVTLDAALLDVVARFQSYDCVLVFNAEKKLCGIVTPADIASEFQAMTAPFLVIGEIETQLRWLIDRALDLSEVTFTAAPAPKPGAPPSKAADLTMGELERILENPEYWAKIGMTYDRVDFCQALSEMRKFRNETMHFGDPLSPAELTKLRNFATALRLACAAAAKST